MAMTLIMFINITQLHIHLYFVKKLNPISMLYGVGRMGCRAYGVSDISGVGRMGRRTYISYVRPTLQLVVNYCIMNKKKFQTNKINIISRLVTSCNCLTSVGV